LNEIKENETSTRRPLHSGTTDGYICPSTWRHLSSSCPDPAKPVSVERPDGDLRHPNLLKAPLLGQDPGAGTRGAEEASGVTGTIEEELRSKCEGEQQRRTTKLLGLLRREVHEVSRNPKLYDQVDGPYCVIETDGRVFKLRIGDDDVPVSSGQIIPAPESADETKDRGCPADDIPPPVDADKDGVTTPEEDDTALE
jgi:hypothetical protein